MKLTNHIRDTFVASAMKDVPYIDYLEQYRQLITADAVAQLPEKVRKIYNDPATRPYIAVEFYYPDSRSFGLCTVYIPRMKNSEFTPSAETVEKAKELYKLHNDQKEVHRALKDKLTGVAYGCTTRKQLVEMLPEFEKYLPVEPEKSRNLPTISNMVGDFIRAGWPKDKTSAAA